MVIRVAESELSNYNLGQEITYPNYSILKTDSSIYLLDYDVLRPFASEEVVRKMGFNPQEMISATEAELLSYPRGETITIDNKSPQGVIFKLTDSNTSYLFKDNKLYPFLSKKVAEINYKNLSVEKHKMNELTNYEIIQEIVNFKDGTLLKVSGSNRIYVMENGKKRPLADNDTFLAMGYKKSNVITAQDLYMAGIPQGEEIFLNVNLVSAKNKFLGDSESLVSDLFNTKVPSYLVAEYPSGRIISGKDIDTMRPLASFTKLMTAFEALDQGIDFKKTTTYDSKKYEAEGNVLQLQNGEKIKNVDLFNAMLIRSINNVARMVAQSTALTEEDFVSAMNKTLANWGADNTTIADTTGIDPNNQSTPRDLLKIFTKVLTNKTIKDTLFKTTYTFKEVLNKNKISKHALQNTNQLLNRSGRNYRILASKTGYLEDSGFNIIMLIESKINKKQYIVITMGDPNYAKRFEEPHKIAQWIATGKVKITNKN